MSKSHENISENYFVRTKLLNRNNAKIIKILKRSDFLALNSKFRVRARGLNLQARKRSKEELTYTEDQIRVGFTCSKKVGNAVKRNKAKRRLRHLAKECLPLVGKADWDYNIIGHQRYTEEMNFNDLKRSFINAINQIHRFEKSK